jgi:exodeoxyribonuclease V alpha subunit
VFETGSTADALTEAMDEGHCGLPTEELTPLAAELLEVDTGLVQAAMDLELADGTVIADFVDETACIFLGGLYRAEKVIAERLLRLANGALPWPYIDPEKALPWIEQKTGLTLAKSQIAAIRLALLSKVLVVTGGPGASSRPFCAYSQRRGWGFCYALRPAAPPSV